MQRLKRVPHGGFLTPKPHVCRRHRERALVAGVGTTSHLPPAGPVAVGLTPHGKSLHVSDKPIYKINRGEAGEGSGGDSEGPGRAGCGAGGCRDGKEAAVVGVTSGRAFAGARAGRERGRAESSRTGRKSSRKRRPRGRVRCGDEERGEPLRSGGLGDACPGSTTEPQNAA